MRYRVKNYTVQPIEGGVWLYFTAPEGVELSSDPDNEIEPFIQEAIRLIVDESEGIVLCSSMQKRVYLVKAKCNPTTRQIRLQFAVPEGQTVSSISAFTIEMDWGDTISDIISGVDSSIESVIGTEGTDVIHSPFSTLYYSISGQTAPGTVIEEDGALVLNTELLPVFIQPNVGKTYVFDEAVGSSTLMLCKSIDNISISDGLQITGGEFTQLEYGHSYACVGTESTILSVEGVDVTFTFYIWDEVSLNSIINRVSKISDYGAKEETLNTVSSILNSVKQRTDRLPINKDVATSLDINDVKQTVSTGFSNVLGNGSNNSLTVIKGIVQDTATKTDLNNVKSAILGNSTDVTLQSLNTTINDINNKVATLTALNNVKDYLSTQISGLVFPTDYAKDADLTQAINIINSGFNNGAKQNTVTEILNSVKYNNKTTLGELTDSTYGLSSIYSKAATASTDATSALSHITNNTYGLPAIKNQLDGIPTEISNAVARGVAEGIARALKIKTSDYQSLQLGSSITIPVSIQNVSDATYPYGIFRDDVSPDHYIKIQLVVQ